MPALRVFRPWALVSALTILLFWRYINTIKFNSIKFNLILIQACSVALIAMLKINMNGQWQLCNLSPNGFSSLLLTGNTDVYYMLKARQGRIFWQRSFAPRNQCSCKIMPARLLSTWIVWGPLPALALRWSSFCNCFNYIIDVFTKGVRKDKRRERGGMRKRDRRGVGWVTMTLKCSFPQRNSG